MKFIYALVLATAIGLSGCMTPMYTESVRGDYTRARTVPMAQYQYGPLIRKEFGLNPETTRYYHEHAVVSYVKIPGSKYYMMTVIKK